MRTLHREFNEEIQDAMKIAIVTSIMPATIQDYIYTHVEEGMLYVTMVDKIRAIVGNKVTMTSGPTPMDIGGEDAYYQNGEEYEEEVAAIAWNAKCFKCDGWGHASRECPSKGKGKGDFKGYMGQRQGRLQGQQG